MFGWENQVDKDTKTLLNNDAEPEDEEIEEMDTYLSKERRWQRVSERQRIDEYHGLWRSQEPVLYAPDRGPPILDFMSIFGAFVVAVIAAYYTITY